MIKFVKLDLRVVIESAGLSMNFKDKICEAGLLDSSGTSTNHKDKICEVLPRVIIDSLGTSTT